MLGKVKFEKIEAMNPEIDDWKESGIEQEVSEPYKSETKYIVFCLGVLAGYSVLYGFLGALFLKLVDKR